MFGFLFVLPSPSSLSLVFSFLVVSAFILWVWFAHFCGLIKKKKNKRGKWVWFGGFLGGILYFLCFLLPIFSFFSLFPFSVLFFVGKKDVIIPCDWWCCGGGYMHGW